MSSTPSTSPTMALQPTGIDSLPNEILTTILSPLPTRLLLPLAPTSRRLHDLILCILHHRLRSAASLPTHQLILEVYRPAAKITTPYFACAHLSTDALPALSSSSSSSEQQHPVGTLGRLRDLYSHYRPLQPEGERRVWRRHPAGGVYPGTMGESSSPPPQLERAEEEEKEEVDYVTQDIDLEPHELFTQLQSQVNLVKVGPRRGLFLSIVEIGEGLTRIWRDWLAERAERAKRAVGGKEERAVGGEEELEGENAERLLWSEQGQNIGLRVRVVERDDVPPSPILQSRHEDPHVGYTLEYEELIVRTSHLLLKYEQSLEQEVSSHGKALVIVS